MTIAQSLTRTTPLNFTNRATAPRPTPAQGPTDGVSLGSSAPPQEPDLRDPEQGRSRLALGLAVGALALVGAGLVIGGLAGPGTTQVQPAEISPELRHDSVDRNAEPISQEQWAQMKQIGDVLPQDNQSARQVKEGYLDVAQEMLTEADYFRSQGQTLEQEGQRLEFLGKELGNGTHEFQGGTVTVELRADGISVTQQLGEVTKSIVRNGETTVIEINEGQGETRLEDTGVYRSVSEGQTTRTLFLKSGILHPAGEFEVQTASRSVQQTTRVAGTNISRHTDQLVSGYAGRESISETQKWEKPELSIALYPGTVVQYRQERTSQNLSLDSESQSFREVDVRQDGSARVKHNYTLEGTAVETIEPGLTTPTVIQ